MPDYLQHGRRHAPGGDDPIPNLGGAQANDWVIASAALGTVTNGSSPVNGVFTTIDYQTDGGSVFGVDTSGSVASIGMLTTGTYLIRARATFPAGHTGNVQVQGVIAGGGVTTYDYDTAVGGTHYTDIGPGEATWSQLCVVTSLPAAAYMTFTQTTGGSLVGCVAHLQIFRLT